MTSGFLTVDRVIALSAVAASVLSPLLTEMAQSWIRDPRRKSRRRMRRMERRAARRYRKDTGEKLRQWERCTPREMREIFRHGRPLKDIYAELLRLRRPKRYVEHLLLIWSAEEEDLEEKSIFSRCHLAAAFFHPLALGEISLYNETSYA